MPSEARQHWFARMMEAGLGEKIFEPADVLAHATPEVLANHLPPDLMSRVLQTSLAAGSMTPERVIETVTPDLMALHLPHEVLWACIAGAAERSGMVHDPNAAPPAAPAAPPAAPDSSPPAAGDEK